MAERKSIAVILSAEVDRYKSNMRSARGVTSELRAEVKAIGSVAVQHQESLRDLGQAFLVGGLAIGGALVASGKAAIDFESSFAGVRKTVEGTPAQLREIAAGLREMATEIPVNVNELNRIAEAAGQLGVKRENILSFTRVMADLGNATNLTGAQAATSLARFGKITGMVESKVDRLGSTVVALGNNSATTEAEIVDMALRIAAAGTTIGLSESEILGFSAALSSVGLEAEAGGTAISRVMVDIATAIANGSDELGVFADTAGMSVDEFAEMFERDAGGAIIAFIGGLSRMQESGENVFGTLEELGFNQVRVRDALLRSASAGDQLTTSIDLASSAWEENNALTEEANRRYATTESRIQVAKQQLNDFAVDMGQLLLPALGASAEMLGSFFDGLTGLPGPAKAAVGGIVGVSGAALTLGGGLLLLAPRIHRTSEAMDAIKKAGGPLGRALGGVGKFIGPLTFAFAAAAIGLSIYANAKKEAEERTRKFVEALQSEGGAIGENTVEMLRQTLAADDSLTALNKLGITVEDFGKALDGDSGAMERFEAALKAGRAEGKLSRGETADLMWAYMHLDPALKDARLELERVAESERKSAAAAQDATSDVQLLAAAEQDKTRRLIEATSAAAGADRAMQAYAAALSATLTAEDSQTFEEYLETLGDVDRTVNITAEDLEKFMTVGERVALSLRENLIAAMREATTVFDEAPEAIKISLEEMLDNVAAHLEQNTRFAAAVQTLADLGLEGVVAALREKGPAAVDAAEALASNTAAAFRMEGMMAGHTGAALDEFVQRIYDERWRARREAEGLGHEVGVGVRSGVVSGADGLGDELGDQMSSQISSAIYRTKRRFGIRSPSEVLAREVGRPLAAGIAVGVRKEAPQTAKAVRVATESMVGEMRSLPRVPAGAGAGPGMATYGSSTPFEIHTHVDVDGREIARSIDLVVLDDRQDEHSRGVN